MNILNQSKLAIAGALLLAGSVISGAAAANTITYNLTADPNLVNWGGSTVAQVTLTDVTGGVEFTVEGLVAGSRISGFGFNFLNSTAPSGFSIPLYPATGGLPQNWVSVVNIYTGGGTGNGGFNGFGKFDVDVHDGGQANWQDPLVFTVVDPGYGLNVGTIASYQDLSSDGSSFFAAHVTNLDSSGVGSCSAAANGVSCTAVTGFAGLGTVVPVPAAVWLFGSGLLGLVGVARRKAV